MKRLAALFIAIGMFAGASLTLADDLKTERVHFKQGMTGTTIKGKIKGYATIHYIVGAQSGQTMMVELQPKDSIASFNLFAPGKIPGQDEALFFGDSGGSRFEGVLTVSGDYIIQVLLFRNEARRNELAKFSLNVEIAASRQ